MSTAVAAPEDTRTVQEVVRDHLAPIVTIVDRLRREDMNRETGTAVAVLALKARDTLAKHSEADEEEALAAGIAVMAQLSTEWGLEKTCNLEGPDPAEAFLYLRTFATMVRERLEEVAHA